MYGTREGMMNWQYEDHILDHIISQEKWYKLSPEAALEAVRTAEDMPDGFCDNCDYLLALSNPHWIDSDGTRTLTANAIVNVDKYLGYLDEMGVDQIAIINTIKPFLQPEELDAISVSAYHRLHNNRPLQTGEFVGREATILTGDDQLTRNDITPPELTIEFGSRHIRTPDGGRSLRIAPTTKSVWFMGRNIPRIRKNARGKL